MSDRPVPLVVAMRCAACGRGFSTPTRHLIARLKEIEKRPHNEEAFLALCCSDCGSGGKSEHDGVLVRLTDGGRPLLGPVEWKPARKEEKR